MTFRKKLENFWYYHKWHTILVVFLVSFGILTTYQMMTKTVYDNTVVVAGNVPSTLADNEAFYEDIKYCFKDTNADDEINIGATFVPLGGEIESTTDAEMALAYPQQLQALIAADDANIFIVTEDILLDYGKDKAFADVSSLQEELGLSDCKYYNGIKITNHELIKNLNLYSDVEYYIAVRVHKDMDSMGNQKKLCYENAYSFMRELTKPN